MTKQICPTCFDFENNSRCQCLSCDPDGTRYVPCTCDELNTYVGEYTDTIYYDEDIVKILKKTRDFIKRVKTQDYYVRGYEDARVIMLEVLDYVINKLEQE